MTLALQPVSPSPIKSGTNSCIPHRQRGVVLIIALVLLVVISLLAVTSMRNAGSSESVAGNVRTTELATQAAEFALRHCESLAAASPATFPQLSTPAQWQNMATWDGASSAVIVAPLSLLNQAGMTKTYQRPSECMVQMLPSTTASFVVTARGFGPEVAEVPAGASRVRPVGSEVWLQSHIEFE